MRLLHMSDWHLGKTLYKNSRREDIRLVIDEMLELARQTKPHLILHTGDLFDAPRPAVDAMQQGVTALEEFSKVAPVVVLSGNHDSPALFRLFDQLVGRDGRIRFVDRAKRPKDGGILDYPGEDGERIRLAALPFVHANRRAKDYQDFFEASERWMASYSDSVRKLWGVFDRGLSEDYDPSRDVLLVGAHLMVSGATISRSERPLYVGEAYMTEPNSVPSSVSYAAFGHVHKPQRLPGGTVTGRFAGSPIQLDFGEEDEEKEVVFVEAKPGMPAKVEPIRLSAGRRLKTLSGTLEEIGQRAPGITDELLKVVVDTKTPTPDLSERVQELLPDATLVMVDERCEANRVVVVRSGDIGSEELSFTALFREYLNEQGTRNVEADRVLRAFEDLSESVEDERVDLETDDELSGAEEGGDAA